MMLACQALRTAVFTASGSGKYSREIAEASPFVYAQSKNFITAAERAGSAGALGSSMNVADSIGQLFLPGWSIRLTAKFSAFAQSPFAAAAWKASIVGLTNTPALLRSCTVTRWFWLAKAYST